MIPLLLFLLGCAAIYVATLAAAFSALLRLSLRLIAERDGHELVSRYLDDPVTLLLPARLLLGIIYALATVFFSALIGGAGLHWMGLLLLAVAAFIFVSEHLVPMLFIRHDPERVLAVLLPSFHLVARTLSPLTLALVRIGGAARHDRHERHEAAAPGPEGGEPEAAAETAGAEVQKRIEGEERRLLRSIVDFGNTLVREVMTPRPDMVAIRSDATLDELRALFAEQEYSRVPVYKDDLDNVLGFVFVKDLIQVTNKPGSERVIPSLLRPAHVVPETKPVADLLKEFQRRQVQIAIVVDEYGGTAGLATLEDLLEEIVGEIRDEYDVEVEPIVDEGNGVFVVSGKVDIDKIAERLELDIEREGFETLGGYVLAHVGRVPNVGEVLDIDGLTIEVLEAERRRVHRVRIRRRQPAETRVE